MVKETNRRFPLHTFIYTDSAHFLETPISKLLLKLEIIIDRLRRFGRFSGDSGIEFRLYWFIFDTFSTHFIENRMLKLLVVFGIIVHDRHTHRQTETQAEGQPAHVM